MGRRSDPRKGQRGAGGRKEGPEKGAGLGACPGEGQRGEDQVAAAGTVGRAEQVAGAPGHRQGPPLLMVTSDPVEEQ